MLLFFEHFLFCFAAATTLLLSDLVPFALFFGFFQFPFPLKFLNEKLPCALPIFMLLAKFLNAHGNGRRAIAQFHTITGLIDFLPPMSAAANEAFFHFFWIDRSEERRVGKECRS